MKWPCIVNGTMLMFVMLIPQRLLFTFWWPQRKMHVHCAGGSMLLFHLSFVWLKTSNGACYLSSMS